MKYTVITFGCRVNQADSLETEVALRDAGATAVASPKEADLVIVNTCSVTATAEQDARQAIRRVARENPSSRILVTGCYATRRPDDVGSLPNVWRLVSNDEKPHLLQGLSREFEPMIPTERGGDGVDACRLAVTPGATGRTAFTLRVQTGCQESCAYCVIPSTRGRPCSIPPDKVLQSITSLAAADFKEIVLAGVHLGSYGRDLMPRSSLAELLNRLHGRTAEADQASEVRLRVSSLEPMDCTPKIVELIAGASCFAPHFHLPLQHASDEILRAMRRPYAIAQYAALVDGIRALIPHGSIGTDVIVGFPGESDGDFEYLASYLEQSPLTQVHVFPYSDRPGTAASGMGDRVPSSVIQRRARWLRAIGQRLTLRFQQSQIGMVHRGLTLENGTLVVTGNYLKVRIPPGHRRNEWVTVKISGASSAGVAGEVVDGFSRT